MADFNKISTTSSGSATPHSQRRRTDHTTSMASSITDLSSQEMTDQPYLDAHHIRAHLTDALSLLQHTANTKIKPLEFLASYFTLLSSTLTSSTSSSPAAAGSILFHRDFKYVNSCPDTRYAFITLFRRCFSHFLAGDSSTSANDAIVTPESIHQFCLLLCVDFPFSLVRNAARITNDVAPASSSSSTPSSSPMTFSEFTHKLFVLFYYSEFLNACALAFRSLDTNSSGRVSRAAFQARLNDVWHKKKDEFSWPDLNAIEDAIQGTMPNGGDKSAGRSSSSSPPAAAVDDEMMFNSFCVDLFTHPHVYAALGADR